MLLPVFNLVSIIFNFYFHFAGTDSQCLDENNEGFMLRHWLFVTGAIKISLWLSLIFLLIIDNKWRGLPILYIVININAFLMLINNYVCVFI